MIDTKGNDQNLKLVYNVSKHEQPEVCYYCVGYCTALHCLLPNLDYYEELGCFKQASYRGHTVIQVNWLVLNLPVYRMSASDFCIWEQHIFVQGTPNVVLQKSIPIQAKNCGRSSRAEFLCSK